jgi:hypothetical protein
MERVPELPVAVELEQLVVPELPEALEERASWQLRVEPVLEVPRRELVLAMLEQEYSPEQEQELAPEH